MCPNGCKDGACIVGTAKCSNSTEMDSCLDNPVCYWDQETGKCYDYKQKCSDPDGGDNIYAVGHTFGFRTYSSAQDPSRDLRIRTGGKDACMSYSQLLEHYCADDYTIQTLYRDCPDGCSDGMCIKTAYCGNGICEMSESQQSCPQDCVNKCPALIDISFNKNTYYPGDYFEATVKIYDYNKNLMPNHIFNIYNSRVSSSSTHSTDAAGIYRTASTVPNDAGYAGGWKFTASVSQENCQYVYDEESFTIVIQEKCGDNVCDADERELTCGKTCACPVATSATKASSSGGGSSAYATGAMTASVSQIAIQETPSTVAQESTCICKEYCHVRCPKDCTPNCGNGVCDSIACIAVGCPVSENENNCQEDCSQKNYCGTKSSDQNCICESGYVKQSFGDACPSETTEENTASTGVQKTLEAGYRNAYWKCHDGTEYNEGGTTSCKSSATWYGYAETSCTGRCLEDGSKCGVNSFSVTNECTNDEIVKEQVKCVFDGSVSAQKCFSADGLFRCEGAYTCVADVYGKKGSVITWKSSCGSYAYTKLDGENDYATFNCKTGACTYYKCVPDYSRLSLSTDKYSYNIGEVVTITTNSFKEGQISADNLKVSVTGPYKDVPQTAVLTQVCNPTSVCPSCEIGGYCPPCESKDTCFFRGNYYDTKAVGVYDIASLYSGSDLKNVNPTQFRVYDYSLLDNYLILKDIDGFKYRSANTESGPGKTTVYAATYEKNGGQYAAMAADFESRADLENYLNDAFKRSPPSEEKIGGYYVYALSSGSQKIYAWTYKTFLIVVAENAYVTTGLAQNIVPTEKTEIAASVSGAADLATTESASGGKGFFTGMITGMPTASSPPIKQHCGSDSAYPECACNDGETKESFQPKCTDAVCGTHYRCKPAEPMELISAYLDKYPSDIKATGTECETKSGYCIYFQDSCKDGFEDSALGCKTKSDKCCVKEVDREDFLEIVMKLEGMRVKMDKMERNSNSLADYYTSTGDDERAAKFRDVASMFANAKGMVDDITEKIRGNLDNLEAVRKEIKSDIQNLRSYISGILERMVL